MKKCVIFIICLLVLSVAGSAVAQVKISGDARVRPRLDIKDAGEFGNSSTNGYYVYRARLNFKSDIGEGWFGHIQLGTAGFGYFTGLFGDKVTSNPSAPSSKSVGGAYRGPVDFMLIYFGRKTEKFGYWGGLMPINSLANPLYDIHYYSDIMIDAPFFCFSNLGAHGFRGFATLGNTKFGAAMLVDNNDGIRVESPTDSVISDLNDRYTLMLDATIPLGEVVVQPVLLAAIADTDMPAPTTVGANISSPKVGNLTFSGSFASSTQSKGADSLHYSAWLARIKVAGKIGTGHLTAWVDLANKSWDESGIEHKFTYFWLSYAIPVFESEQGSVSIKPTWRHIQEKVDGVKDYKREKIELTIDFKFN